MIDVHEFKARHDNGPAVTATRRGQTWQFAWKGGSTLLTCSYRDAQRVAEQIAQDLADVAPLEAEVQRRHEDTIAWVESQREPAE